jgi:hypothetical protein
VIVVWHEPSVLLLVSQFKILTNQAGIPSVIKPVINHRLRSDPMEKQVQKKLEPSPDKFKKHHLMQGVLTAFLLLISVSVHAASNSGIFFPDAMNNHSGVIESEEFQRTITGTVTDRQGDPIPGVTVVVSGTTVGTTTNTEGQYSLSVPAEGEYLTFTSLECKHKIF